MKKATGIVRRIDDLGRIVLPKELRRTLRIRENDPLEIYIDDGGEIILKKYSPIINLNASYINEYAKTLQQMFGDIDVLICDDEKICAAAGSGQKHYMGKKIHDDMFKILTQKQCMSLLLQEKERINITFDDKEISTQAISIIKVNNDDIAGAIISLDKKSCRDPEKLDYLSKTTAAMAHLIGTSIFF